VTAFLAKPDQSYEHHVEAAHNAWREVLPHLIQKATRLQELHGCPVEGFVIRSLLAVVLHDLGKLIVPFQRMMDAVRRGRKPDYRENYRHELASFPFVVVAGIELNKRYGPYMGNLPLEALAVAAHHRRLNTDMTSFERERLVGKVAWHEDGVQRGLELAADIFRRNGFQFPDLPLALCREPPFVSLSNLISKSIFAKLMNGCDRSAVRSVYALIRGALHYADWYGSAGVRVDFDLEMETTELLGLLERRCLERSISFRGLRPFQEECAATLGHVVAVAPTGSGKTEAALMWGLANLRNLGGGKLIYLLPTMVTATSIFRRLEDFFGKQAVGLTHSTASFILEDEYDNDRGDSAGEKRNFLFDRTFVRPATVATVDQALASGFNTGAWTMVETNLSGAVVIIDEIHAYEPWTLGLIRETLSRFSNLGTRFMLMSATLPEPLIKLFSETLPNAAVIRDRSLLDSCRNRYYTIDRPIEEAINLIEEAVREERRALVVVNNVRACQEMFRRLEHLDPLCYHSKFILKDRSQIEHDIDRARLVVATQVIEVSLDIDFDVMFTECAPPDAVAQRAGRVNRRRLKNDSRIYVFRASEVSRKIYDPCADGLLDRSFSVLSKAGHDLTEADILRIVEDVYAGRRVEEMPDFLAASAQYGLTWRRLMGVFDNLCGEDKSETTRKVEYLQVPVIPSQFRDEVMELSPARRRWYEVKMPYWYVRNNGDVVGETVFCEMQYDSRIGATLSENDGGTLIV
jgi:CRISPR-associated endonuclease/helicase Cas3